MPGRERAAQLGWEANVLCHSFGLEIWLGAKGLPKSSWSPRMHPHLHRSHMAVTYFPAFGCCGEAMVEPRSWGEDLLSQLHQTWTGSISLPGSGTHPANTIHVHPAHYTWGSPIPGQEELTFWGCTAPGRSLSIPVGTGSPPEPR